MPLARDRFLGILASVVLVGCTVVYFVWRPVRSYRIPTSGMAPAIPTRTWILVRTTRDCGTGDIVAFRYPLEPRVVFVKRIVAKGGDVVEIRDKRLFVNGAERAEPYVQHVSETIYPKADLPEPYRSRDQFGPLRVAPESFFVLGDNRDASSDSRYWGTVPRANLIGRVIGAYSSRGFYRPR